MFSQFQNPTPDEGQIFNLRTFGSTANTIFCRMTANSTIIASCEWCVLISLLEDSLYTITRLCNFVEGHITHQVTILIEQNPLSKKMTFQHTPKGFAPLFHVNWRAKWPDRVTIVVAKTYPETSEPFRSFSKRNWKLTRGSILSHPTLSPYTYK